jgi:uncharacterized protein (DUF1697 family)
MTRQIGLLRGINVGGKNRVPMAQLRELMEALGYTGVETLLQSGNVVFGSNEPAATSERRIARRLRDETGLDIKVLVRTRAELAAAVKRNPLGKHADNPKHHHVMFLSARPDPELVAAVDPADYEPEMFELHGRELFMWWPAGAHNARLTHSFWERKLKVTATARNWNTVQRLLEMAASEGPV